MWSNNKRLESIMKNRIINLFIVLAFGFNNFVYAEENNLNKTKPVKQKTYKVPDVSFGADEPQKEELIQVSVRNEFDEEIKVKLDTNREYPIGPNESISLGQRKPGKYTLTIYNKKGEFIDNLTRNIDQKNKFILNKNTVSNSDKITGLTTGQKVAITAGALGAATLGGVLINKALQENEQITQQQNQPQIPSSPVIITEHPTQDNAFVAEGMLIKFLNTKYPNVTLIIEGTDGQPIGNNWVIPLSPPDQKPQPLIFNGERVTINSEQKINAILPNGFQLQRYGFELEVDPADSGYIWLLK